MQYLVFKPTQYLRVLKRFLDQEYVMVYELMTPRPHGEGTAQYGTRIKELRAYGYRIDNVEKGKFRLDKSNLLEIIEKLRFDYTTSTGTKKEQIKAEGMMVKQALNIDPFYQAVNQYILN
jgi:hypothetical protein